MAPEYLSNNMTLRTDVPDVNTRSHAMDVCIPFTTTELYKRRFMYSGPYAWNHLPHSIKDCKSLDAVKSALKPHV